MNNFLLSTASQQEIQSLDNKIHETVETINQLKTNREFFLSFAKDPQQFINKWIISQTRDLKTMTDVVGNPEEERRADFYYQPWAQEAVCRYFYTKVQQKRAENWNSWLLELGTLKENLDPLKYLALVILYYRLKNELHLGRSASDKDFVSI